MNFSLFKGKSKRTTIFTLITVFSIVFLLVANFLLAYFSPLKSIYFDMTSENLYTLSDAMKEETASEETSGDNTEVAEEAQEEITQEQ